MEDVARAAGVSRTTVSFVLNNRDGARIAPETRERVQQVAVELGYRPHGGARALASRRSSLIGLVSEIVTSPFGAATIRGIQDTVRRAGCEAYLERAGIPWSTVSSAIGHGTTRGGYAAAARLLTDHPWLTGLVCGNDRMAMGAYDAIRERGLRVREDVAVIGIDDQELIADQVHPALTTVALPFEEMGQVAVSHLLDLMAGEEVPAETLLPGQIIRRSSA